jgi:alpha-beta hydrolase superfamily lysophospholipase
MIARMRPANVIQIVTPKGVNLNGLWFGPVKPKRVVVLVHGLMSSAFSMRRVLALVDTQTAVVTFNNRGHGLVNYITKNIAGTKNQKWVLAGCAHEVFTECVDDIEGALSFVRGQGVKNIWLAGHSTGCQKSIYFASRGNTRNLMGIILLSPISDYASYLHIDDKKGKYKKALAAAKALVKAGKPHEMLPASLSGEFACDAQRFISLYTPDSPEEIFCYVDPNKKPKTLQKVKVPILTILSGKDEYTDRPAHAMKEWFDTQIKSPHRTIVVAGANHSFTDNEEELREAIAGFMKGRYN